MFTLHSYSFWGSAQNPFNYSRVVGGSSGGEGALVASKCSPSGIGSDIAGSVRSPALFNGVIGFKPTTKRVSDEGNINIGNKVPGHIGPICCTLGPISYTVDDSVLFMKALWTEKMFTADPQIPRMLFN